MRASSILISAVTLSAMIAFAPNETETLPDPHGHRESVHAEPWSTEMAPLARLVAFADRNVGGRDTTVTDDERWTAFVVERWDEIRVRVEGRFGRNHFEVDGLPLPHLPIDNLVWVDDRYLVFDRWVQPARGFHFVLDMRDRRLVHVYMVDDKLER